MSKIRPFSQKHIAVMWFFSIFLRKTPCCHAHWWSKNVNTDKTTLFYGPQKSIKCSLFRLFIKKSPLLSSDFVTNVHSLKNTCSQAYILSKKLPFFQKDCVPMSFFSNMSWKNPLLSCPYLVKKNVNFIKTTLYYWPKKSIGWPFSSYFSQ